MSQLYIIASIAILPMVIWGIYTQGKVRELFQRYSKQSMKKGITGSRLARTMLNSAGLKDVVIEEVGSGLSDHYDPRHKVIRLSRAVARNSSIASIGIAAHETAHAIQDGLGYAPVRLRNNIAPIIDKVSYLLLPLIFFGILIGGIAITSLFLNIAVFIFLGIVIFYLITLPVELEASSRAIRYIKENNVADEKELYGVKKILRAAAFTYLAAAALAVVQFLRLLGMKRR